MILDERECSGGSIIIEMSAFLLIFSIIIGGG